MVDIAVVSDDFSLNNRSLDDLGLLRLRGRAGLTLLLPLNDADMLTDVPVRRRGARALAFTLGFPDLKPLHAGRRRAPLTLDNAGGRANPVSRRAAGLADTVNGMDMNVRLLSARPPGLGADTPSSVDDALVHVDRAGRPSPGTLNGLDLPLSQHHLACLGAPVLTQEGGSAVLMDVDIDILVRIANGRATAGSTAGSAARGAAGGLPVVVVELDPASAGHGHYCMMLVGVVVGVVRWWYG